MFTWYVFRVVVLVILVIFYFILYLSQKKSVESLNVHMELHHSSPMVDEDAFARSIKLDIKSDHQWQCGLMVVATVILAIFDSHYYVIAAMFCSVLSSAHLYLARRIDV